LSHVNFSERAMLRAYAPDTEEEHDAYDMMLAAVI
jgi:hypothetical protein